MNASPLTTVIVSLFSLALAACSNTDAAPQPTESSSNQLVGVEYSEPAQDAPELAYWGAYDVGHRTEAVVQPDRLRLLDIDPETSLPRRGDRELPISIWYPAGDTSGLEKAIYTRRFVQDPKWPMPDFPTTWNTMGEAFQDAPQALDGDFPLVILAHGWAGNEISLVYLAENLASKGYVVIAPDFRDVAPSDPQVFQLLFPRAMINRAIDTHFVVDTMVAHARSEGHWLFGLVDPEQVALIGNSLGGMGAVRVAGAAYDGESPGASWIPGGLFTDQTAQAETPRELVSSHLDALILIAPWGAQDDVNLFSTSSLAQISVPTFVFAGELDAIAGYETGPVKLYEQIGAEEKFLLTYMQAGHGLTPGVFPTSADAYPYGSIGTRDPIWRSAAIANIQQHFVTAFLDHALKQDESALAYLTPSVRNASEGEWPQSADETPEDFAPIGSAESTYWPGFRRHRARGLTLDATTPE